MSSQHTSHPSNRLARETSPYLLQHAHNPVDWWPWGPDAFAEARRRGVPIFLSIGYSTCYWCHVMERESFESADIARIMNERYVCIKVDREERPDVDDLYMAAVQAFSGRGGWPMSVFLEPDRLRPFWAGTYFPAEPRFQGMPTFPDVLIGVSEAWIGQRDEVLKQAEQLAAAAAERAAELHAPRKIGEGHISRAVAELIKMHDARWGGFGGAPKFPQPVFIELLLDVRRVSGDDSTTKAIDAAVRSTLDRMACGGMFDQVGGGFHRYSVDAQWLVPHFEKMLYDNAQLAELYARAAILYQDPWYARIAGRTCEYVLREMTNPDTGAFFSAQDAEVDGREGRNYLWSRDEILDALGPETGAFVAAAYGLDSGPNFRDPHHPEEPASNVLWMADRPEKLAAAANLALPRFLSRLEDANARLYAIRSNRKQPRLDDKAIASWNGLMIRALATCGSLLGHPDYIVAAARAADSLLHTMHAADGGLLRSSRSGQARTPAFLEDYAAVVAGLLALAASGAGDRFATQAVRLAAEVRVRFGAPDGGLFDALDHQPDLFVRPRASFDGAIPSGVGVMIHNWIELADLTGESSFARTASSALASISGAIDRAPLGAANATRALLRLLVRHRSALESALASAEDALPESPATEALEILTSVQQVTVSEHKRGGLVLRVRIAEGFHVAAADPGDGHLVSGLTPFRVHMVNGSGVAIYADYPPGAPFGDEGELRVYQGTFELPVILERQGVWTGRPLIAVTYQACTHDACQAPTTVELDVSVDRD